MTRPGYRAERFREALGVNELEAMVLVALLALDAVPELWGAYAEAPAIAEVLHVERSQLIAPLASLRRRALVETHRPRRETGRGGGEPWGYRASDAIAKRFAFEGLLFSPSDKRLRHDLRHFLGESPHARKCATYRAEREREVNGTLERRCYRCDNWQPADLEHYYPDHTTQRGLSWECRKCGRARKRAWWARERSKQQQQQQQQQQGAA